MSGREMRRDELTSEWVIYAPGRSGRPFDGESHASGGGPPVDYDPDCPFCPGNERLLPPITYELPGPGGVGWSTRVVPNLFPVVGVQDGGLDGSPADAEREAVLPGFYATRSADGRHEVIIETPHHASGLETMPPFRSEAVVETYHRRFLDLSRDSGIAQVILFRNHGAAAGGSLAHPHAQIVGLGVVPDRVRDREERAERYFRARGRCLMCDLVEHEVRVGSRVVVKDSAFVALVPFAARAPLHVWLVPVQHRADFGQTTLRERNVVARQLGDVLARLHTVEGPALPYNMMLHSASRAGMARAGEALHWFMEVRPRLTTAAGLELATGVDVVPSLPEHDAARLRAATVSYVSTGSSGGT